LELRRRYWTFEAIARKNLSERAGRIVAKRLLGIGTQAAIGYGVAKATKSDALGVLAGLMVHAALLLI